jgi:hypothetical protein
MRLAYASTVAEQLERCGVVGPDGSTMRLRVAALASWGKRDTSDSVITVRVKVPFIHDRVEAFPVAMVVGTPSAHHFAVENSLVGDDVRDDVKWKAGGILALNFLRREEVAAGAAIGMATDGAKLSNADFFLGPIVSWREILRVGVGAGYTEVPVRLKSGASVGAALPAGASTIDDVVARDRKLGWSFFIAIPGLSLKNPF